MNGRAYTLVTAALCAAVLAPFTAQPHGYERNGEPGDASNVAGRGGAHQTPGAGTRLRPVSLSPHARPPASTARGPVVGTDVVLEWNAVMQQTVAASSPFLQARSASIVQLAVFEASNSIVGEFEPYLGTITVPPGASRDSAVVAAAHRALVTLYPANVEALDAARAASLAAIPDGQAKDDGVALGEAAADALVALRADDGSDAPVDYTPGTEPGEWQPTPPAFAAAAFPGWGQVTPFGLESGAQFRPGPPPALGTGRYARDYNELKAVGGANSADRPQDRTHVAQFYAGAPPVQVWNAAARQVIAAQDPQQPNENARALALLAMAINDALIASMEAKFFYNLWRPVTAIRSGDTDGNARTEPDAEWLPLVVTPPYPAYPGNMISAAGAARAVLERLYGRGGHAIALTSPSAPGVELTYTRWRQIVDDVDDARIYGGIHFRFDQQAGARLGRRVGSWIVGRYLARVNVRGSLR